MPNFSFQAISKNGRQEVGIIEAEDASRVHTVLVARGLTPVSIESAKHQGVDEPWWRRDISLSGGKIKPNELYSFYSMFSTMLDAKLPLKTALRYCQEQLQSTRLRAGLKTMIDDLDNGYTFSDAMEKHPRLFEERFIVLFRIGEKSNTLEQSACQCEEMLKHEIKIRSEIRSALIYPVILMFMAIIVLAIVLFHLVPTLVPVFTQSGTEPPLSISVLIRIRVFALQNWLYIIVCVPLFTFIIWILSKKYATILEPIWLHLPIAGKILRDRESQRFAKTVALILQSGGTLPVAINMVKAATPWINYKNLFDTASETVASGGLLSDGLTNSSLVSPSLVSIIKVGEQSDKLVPMLKTASDVLEKSHRDAIQNALKLLTPTLTLIIGLTVGGLIFATLSAIMDINDVVF